MHIIWHRMIVAIAISLACLLNSGDVDAVNVRDIYGASSDATPPTFITSPCTSSGFSVESTLTLTGFISARLLRINQSAFKNQDGVGYVVGGNGDTAQIWLAAFNMDTMALIGTYEIQPAGGGAFGSYTSNGRYAGATSSNDLFVFMLNRQSGFGGTCLIIGNCAALLHFNGANFQGVGDLLTQQTSQMDDVKFSNTSTLTLVNSDAGGNRRLSLWSSSSLTHLGTGAVLGPSGFGLISRAMNGYNYVVLGHATASPNLFRIPVGTVAADASATIPYGASRFTNAVYTYNDADGLLLNDSIAFGGLPAVRYFTNVPALTHQDVTTTYVLGDGDAAYQSTFWDSVNSKVYTTRGGALATNLIRTDGLATIEQRFGCGTCQTLASQGHQMTDYAPNMSRIFLVNDANPPVVNKIKVCATGGP